MQFTVSSKQLFTKLQNVGKVVNNKNTLPILDCFLFGLTGNTLKIAATDGEIRISTKIEVENQNGNGIICLNAKNILDILKEIPDQPLKFEINDDNKEVFVFYHNGKYNFIGQEASDYPQPRPLDENVRQDLVIDADVLLTGINSTLFASADDELRPVMNGIYLDITKENTTFVASDGHKLVRLMNQETKGSNNSSFILPKKGASILKLLLQKQKDSIKVRFDFNNAFFDLSDYSVTTRFIDGRYPNYNSVIPTDNNNVFIISRDILSAIIKRVSVFSNPASSLIKLDISNNALVLSAQDIDFSTAATEETQVDYNGVPMVIGFKGTFLVELLANIQSDEVEIRLSHPSKAVLILPKPCSHNWEHTSLIMPMMLND